MSPPLVSIVMTNFNHSRFLPEAVDAILGQSYRIYELIIVDDGSTDGSQALLEQYRKRDPRITVLLNEQNRGVIPSSARGTTQARGEFLYLAASDDKMLPGFLEKTVSLLQSHPQASLCWTDPCLFFETDGPLYRRRTDLTPGTAYIPAAEIAEAYRSGRLTAPMHAAPALLRRADFTAAGGLLPELRWYCDFFVTLVMTYRTGLCYIPEALTSTRVQGTSYSRSGSARKDAQREVLTSLLDLFLTPAYRDVVPLVRQSGVLSYFGSLVYKLAKSRPEYAEVLDPRFRGRARYFSLKHAVRRRMSPSLQRCYFSLRNAFRSKTAPGA